jgi:hypothetical protein
MTNNKNIINAFNDLFSKVNSMYKIPIGTFLSSRKIMVYEEHLLSKFTELFPITFDGIVHTSYDEDGTGKLDNSDRLNIKANNLKELLTSFVDESDDYYADNWYGRRLRINQIKYQPDGRIILYLREYENDYLDSYHSILYNALIKEGYYIKYSTNNFIYWEGELLGISIYNTFEPHLAVIKFTNLMDLPEIEVKCQVETFTSELKTLRYYPANLSNDEYAFILFELNHFGLLEDLRDEEDFWLLGECLVSLHGFRKKIKYSVTEQDTVQHLRSIINNKEQNLDGNDIKLPDYQTHLFEEYIEKSYVPSATFEGKDFHFMVIENGNGDIILWHYEKTGNEVTIEYSIRLLTDKLIMNFK